MKIVYIFGSSVPSRTAASVHVMKMCQAFAGNGHAVTLLTLSKTNAETGIDDAFGFYGVRECFAMETLPRVPSRRWWHHVYGLMAAWKARRMAPDLVYGRSLPSCFFSALLGLPVVYESHQSEDATGRMTRWMFSRLIRSRQLRRIVVISGALRRIHERSGTPGELIMVAYDGADEVGAAEKTPTIDSSRLQVGYVGHLYPGRGIDTVIAMAKGCTWADFHIVGGNESELIYWRQRLNGTENIRMHGFVPPSRTDALRQSFDVLLAPYESKVTIQGLGDTSSWMSPLKIFEYMAAGKPILCSDLPPLREVLQHDETALLCAAEQPDSWIAALTRLRDDRALGARLGRAAMKEFQARYTWAGRAAKVIDGMQPRGETESSAGTA